MDYFTDALDEWVDGKSPRLKKIQPSADCCVCHSTWDKTRLIWLYGNGYAHPVSVKSRPETTATVPTHPAGFAQNTVWIRPKHLFLYTNHLKHPISGKTDTICLP